MKYSLHIWSGVLFLALAGAAVADEVKLKNGQTLEGSVRESGNKIIVDVGSGTITLDRSEVSSFRRPNELVQEFDRQEQAIRPDDASGYYQLAVWARQYPDMKTRSDSLLKKALEADPNYEPAHRALGHVNYKGAWLTPDEHKAALGLVRYQGEWTSAEAAERLRSIDKDQAVAAGKQAGETERNRQELLFEREQLAQRARLAYTLGAQVPFNVATAIGFPWAMRYWGAAQPVAPQPTAD
jgi:hypothetical protein